jgi:hypothetical protein
VLYFLCYAALAASRLSALVRLILLNSETVWAILSDSIMQAVSTTLLSVTLVLSPSPFQRVLGLADIPISARGC